jgi:hypothetical protein
MKQLLAFVIAICLASSSLRSAEPDQQKSPTTNSSIEQQKLELARSAMNLAEQLRARGLGPQSIDDTARWSRRLMEAQRHLAVDPHTRAAAVAEHIERMKKLEQQTTAQFRAGLATQLDVYSATFLRLEAEELASADH